MENKYPHLFSPIRIGNLRLKNRIIAAPSSPSLISSEGYFLPEMTAYLALKAKGGAAVVTYGEGIVDSLYGQSHDKQLRLDAFGVSTSLTQTAKAIKHNGAYANVQLSHGGKYGGIKSVGGEHVAGQVAYGVSDEVTPLGEKIHEMPKEIIQRTVDAFAAAALKCKMCGFDMVMVHAAHGWLFSQFLSPTQNRRTDEFGGSLENRARFLCMTLDAIRAAVGPNFPIEIRFPGDDLHEDGIHLEETKKLAVMIQDKVDLFNVSCGDHEIPELFCRTHPSAFYPRGVNVFLAAEIKKVVNKPVACVGSLNDPAQMEEIIASGQADIVELGRAMLADPFLPKKAYEGRAEDITYCLRCYECFCEGMRSESTMCTVNPVIGNEIEESIPVPAPEKIKKVLIAGGGPAGMEAAIIAAQRGHDVTICEQSDRLGGALEPAGTAFFKQDIHLLRDVLERRVYASGAKVLLNTKVTPDFVKKFNPDTLFVAIGSEPIVPPIEGIKSDKVILAADAEKSIEKLGENVVVIGGGLIGSECAIAFAADGKKVTIVEMLEKILPDCNILYRGALIPELNRHSVKIYTNARAKAVTGEGVVCVDKEGKQFTVEADSVVLAAGYRARRDLVDELANLVDECFVIGDCTSPARIGQAMSAGHYAAKYL